MYQLPQEFGDPTAEWVPKDGDYEIIDEGIYPASIFSVEKKQSNKNGKTKPFYKVVFRLDGGPFDGKDITDQYVGLVLDDIFRLYDLLKAVGTIENYYNAEQKKWRGIPSEDELTDKKVFVKVIHEPFHAKKDGAWQYETDGSARILNSARPGGYFTMSEPMPEFRSPKKTVQVEDGPKQTWVQGTPVYKAGLAPQGGAVPGGVPTAGGGTFGADTPW